MTKGKTQKVKVKLSDAPKPGKDKEIKQSFTEDEKNALGGFFDALKKSLIETADKMGLSTKENHSYYVAFCYVNDGQNVYDGVALNTNLNLYERHGYGLKLLSQKLKSDNNIESDVVILNVVRLED